ncbi:Wzz/FepE/Etk N-terminal domain-containing protein [Isachenkonia alkalipeptolytica]|nr:Wzz/FepE/Etk N-terminal domain-containing protein [Isachenkonia alkalipeptolytica]
MEQEQQNNKYQEEEISLRELIETLVREKYIVIATTLVVVIAAAFYTLVVLSDSYESTSTITVNLQEEVSTPYGSYRIPMDTMDEYKLVLNHPYTMEKTLRDYDGELTRSSLDGRMSTSNIQDTGSFNLTFSGSSPGEAYELNRIHLANYLTQVEMMLRRMAIEHFYNEYNTKSMNLEKELETLVEDKENLEGLIEGTSIALNLENALISEAEYSLMVSSLQDLDISELEGDKIITQELNPPYLRLQEELTEKKMEASATEVQLHNVQQSLDELEEEVEALTKYQETLNTDHFRDSVSNSMRNLVTVVNPPQLEESKVGPNNTLNLAIGGVLGLMLGVFIAFFKHYWESTGKQENKASKRKE